MKALLIALALAAAPDAGPRAAVHSKADEAAAKAAAIARMNEADSGDRPTIQNAFTGCCCLVMLLGAIGIPVMADRGRVRLRRQRLVAAYGEENAERIIKKQLWIGAPIEALVEMFGKAQAVDNEVEEGKVTSVFKWGRPHGNSWRGLIVTVVNGNATKWKTKTS